MYICVKLIIKLKKSMIHRAHTQIVTTKYVSRHVPSVIETFWAFFIQTWNSWNLKVTLHRCTFDLSSRQLRLPGRTRIVLTMAFSSVNISYIARNQYIIYVIREVQSAPERMARNHKHAHGLFIRVSYRQNTASGREQNKYQKIRSIKIQSNIFQLYRR